MMTPEDTLLHCRIKIDGCEIDWPGWFAYRPIYVKCNDSKFE